MTRSNRILNRVFLFILGIVALGAGIGIGAGVLPAVRDALDPYVTLPNRLNLPAVSLWAIAVGAVIVIVLALFWVFTRGRGGTSIGVRENFDTGQVTVNVSLLRDVVTHELAGVADIVGTRVDTYRVRSDRAVRIRIAVRRGGDAVTVIAAADRAVAALDSVLGEELPILVHLTGGTKSVLAPATRVH